MGEREELLDLVVQAIANDLQHSGNHGARVRGPHPDNLNIDGHVDLRSLARAALSAVHAQGSLPPSKAWAEYDAWDDFCEKTEPENRTMQGACEFGYAAGKAFSAALRAPEAAGAGADILDFSRREELRDALSTFHRNACYPDAMEGELDSMVNTLLTRRGAASPAADAGMREALEEIAAWTNTEAGYGKAAAIARAALSHPSMDRCICGGSPDQPADHHDISCPMTLPSTDLCSVCRKPADEHWKESACLAHTPHDGGTNA